MWEKLGVGVRKILPSLVYFCLACRQLFLMYTSVLLNIAYLTIEAASREKEGGAGGGDPEKVTDRLLSLPCKTSLLRGSFTAKSLWECANPLKLFCVDVQMGTRAFYAWKQIYSAEFLQKKRASKPDIKRKSAISSFFLEAYGFLSSRLCLSAASVRLRGIRSARDKDIPSHMRK